MYPKFTRGFTNRAEFVGLLGLVPHGTSRPGDAIGHPVTGSTSKETGVIHKIKGLSMVVAVMAGAVLLGAGWSVAESSDQAKLPGDAGPGPYTEGCVSCHGVDGNDSLGTLLGTMKHRNVDKQTATVPGDCKDCHSADEDYTPLSELAHMVHYEKPGENDFVQKYGGNCLHCHALDVKTGIITVKSGPKNW